MARRTTTRQPTATNSGRFGVNAQATAWIGLGANLGAREAALRSAVSAMGALPGTRVLRVSCLYRSAPLDAGGPDYVNAVAEISTTLAPHDLLRAVQSLEQASGRERPYRNAPRTLDLDILLYADLRLESPDLTLPHPRLHERAFVLLPLAELAPERVLPAWLAGVAGQDIERLDGAGWWDSVG